MNSITPVTKNKITHAVVAEKLLSNFPHSKVVSQNDEHEIFIGKIPNNFYIVFDDSMEVDSELCILDEEDKKMIPFSQGKVNYLFFHNIEIAKYAVSIIKQFYEELVIFDDDGIFYTADSFCSM